MGDQDAGQRAEGHAESHQCKRANLADGDLDPQEGGAPDRAKENEDEPVFGFQLYLLAWPTVELSANIFMR